MDKNRLTTSDARGNRIYVYPAAVSGRFRKYRSIIHFVFILIFLIAPWIKINGHQAILLNILQRQFSIFGVTFWAHDAPMLVFIFGGAALTLGLITAVWGRVWCGWACPQTVFIDSVFRKIEQWVEGDHLTRKKLDASPMNLEKLLKKAAKWSLFLLVTLIVTHSLLAYFIGTEELSHIIKQPPSAHPLSFSVMLAMTIGILFDFGWFKEQFCTVVCPYGRFQSLLMDNHSLVIVYDQKRGEPRKELRQESSQESHGDCINCSRCVTVCPTGIDIRDGTQLECIACTACIDACDDVMTRIHKPKGLIRYDSELGLSGKPSKFFRSRTIAYSVLILIVFTGLLFSLLSRKSIEVTFVRAKDSPYQEIKTNDGNTSIVNRYKAILSNQSFEDSMISFEPVEPGSGISIVAAQTPHLLQAGTKSSIELFIKFPMQILKNGHATTKINIIHSGGNKTNNTPMNEEVTLVGPFN